jgi:hypothetical protein
MQGGVIDQVAHELPAREIAYAAVRHFAGDGGGEVIGGERGKPFDEMARHDWPVALHGGEFGVGREVWRRVGAADGPHGRHFVGAEAGGPEAFAVVEVTQGLKDAVVGIFEIASEIFDAEGGSGCKHALVGPGGVAKIELEGALGKRHLGKFRAEGGDVNKIQDEG